MSTSLKKEGHSFGGYRVIRYSERTIEVSLLRYRLKGTFYSHRNNLKEVSTAHIVPKNVFPPLVQMMWIQRVRFSFFNISSVAPQYILITVNTTGLSQ
ncbi:hypothetical protein AB6A40_001545 [Gnathostoma spinigerum]|uniref:Uncharacterized protein n=1 Tax=Gnathostoma spinigerum TaxID=75299 RepID=A0ABD6E6Q3_9BILA